MREYMAKRRQQKRSECNEEPPATKVPMHYKKRMKITLQFKESLIKRYIYKGDIQILNIKILRKSL